MKINSSDIGRPFSKMMKYFVAGDKQRNTLDFSCTGLDWKEAIHID